MYVGFGEKQEKNAAQHNCGSREVYKVLKQKILSVQNGSNGQRKAQPFSRVGNLQASSVRAGLKLADIVKAQDQNQSASDRSEHERSSNVVTLPNNTFFVGSRRDLKSTSS